MRRRKKFLRRIVVYPGNYYFCNIMGNVTYSAISPTDGSLWMTTPGQGLVRVGRNGKAFAYNAAKGDLTCDSIEALAFDSDGTLWMRDAQGTF